QLMGSSIVVLILIWTFSGLITKDLKTGQYLAQFLIGTIPLSFLPMMFFCIATVVSVMMGSAWGTIGMLFPLGIPLVVSMAGGQPPLIACDLLMLYPVLGAIISGAVVGNHLSPISDVMLMSATSAGAYHMDLYKAQVSFSIPSIIAAAVGFGIVGCMLGSYSLPASIATALFVGLFLNVVILAFFNHHKV
ncbi:MAG: Na+/H+ antiporter NhaC family protein, partial [Candidatus Babeliales bacterium]